MIVRRATPLAVLVAVACTVQPVISATAQTYPSRPITVIVPFAASSLTTASAKRATASGRKTASVPIRTRSPRSASAATSSRSRP